MSEWSDNRPVKCDNCSKKFGEQGRDEFVDGATIFGPWMIMCRECHDIVGRGFGIGKGQLYTWLTRKLVMGGREKQEA